MLKYSKTNVEYWKNSIFFKKFFLNINWNGFLKIKNQSEKKLLKSI